MTIKFYKQNEQPYGCFSNYFKGHPIKIDDSLWPTVEHFYQAMKFPGHKNIQEEIRQTDWAGFAWKIGNSHKKLFDSENWKRQRDKIMLKALRAKFSQHQALKQILLSSGSQEIIEHTQNDKYWGDGGDGTGKNKLGKMLMQVRAELQKKQESA